jgi:DNA helicase HerA-like ATPase
VLYFYLSQLPDLKSQRYTNQYGQGVRQKVFANQKSFLLLLSDLGRTHSLTISIRYQYNPDLLPNRQLQIYFVVTKSESSNLSDNSIEQIFNHSFLQEFYRVEIVSSQADQSQDLNWITCIGEAIKYEEIISINAKDSLASLNKKGLPNYYVPLQVESDESNDMLAVCQAMVNSNNQITLEITLEPDTTSLQDKSAWINALDQMLSQLKQASSNSNSSSSMSKGGDRNAQLVSRIYEKYQSSYLTESLYRYSFKVLGTDDLAVRSVLGTLMLSGTKNSRYRTIILTKDHPNFSISLAATQQGQISTATHWDEWDKGLGEAEFGGDGITGKGSVRVADLKPLHRYATFNEIIGLFRLVVPGDTPVVGIAQENSIPSLDTEDRWIDFGGRELTRPDRTIRIKLEQFNKHAFICGVPGSGKTTTAYNLLTQLWCQDIPFLVFEPAKTEYRSLLAIQPDPSRFAPEQLVKLQRLTEELRVYTLGNDLVSPFRFNPFEVSDGVPFYEHISNLEASFRGAISLSGPLPALLSEAIEEIYYDRSWTGDEEGTPANLSIPTMRDLYEKISALFETKDYAGEVKSNLKTALEVRIGSLLRRGIGAMLNTERSSPTIADLLKYPTIIELDYLNQDQANLITFFLLTKIREYIKRQRTEGSGVPEHVILLEEAHNLVGRNLGASSPDDANTKIEAANYVTRMLAEMRALRESIIIADQLPTAVAAEVVKNTNIKIAHRLVSADDRKDIGQAMLLDGAQMEGIARLNIGESFLYMEGWYRPSMIKIDFKDSAKEKLNIDKSITSNMLKQQIKHCEWYHQSQLVLLGTALSEYQRLSDEYFQTFKDIRESFDRVNLKCSELELSLTNLGGEIFYSLAGELQFKLSPAPEILVMEDRIKADRSSNLKHLHPNSKLSLRDLLQLRSDLIIKLNAFDVNYQRVVDLDNSIPRSKYKYQWQQLSRKMQTISRQVSSLCQSLDRPEPDSLIKLNSDIAYEQKKIGNNEELKIRDKFKQLKVEHQKWQEKMTEALDRAVEQAKIDKVVQDLQTGAM